MSGETVKVIVRCRPMNGREKALKCKVAAETYTDVGQVQLHKPRSADEPKKFTFDGAFGMDSNSKMIYEEFGFPLISSVRPSTSAATHSPRRCGFGAVRCSVAILDLSLLNLLCLGAAVGSRGIQRDGVRLRTDWLWQVFHHGRHSEPPRAPWDHTT